MKYVIGSHGPYFSEYHIVWCTKYRRKILNPGLSVYVRKILPQIAREMAGVEIVEIGLDPTLRDHVHLVVKIPPKYSASNVVANFKARSASSIRIKFPWVKKVYWKEQVVWSRGFFLSTVGVNETVIRNYVKWQGKMDSEQVQLSLIDK